MLRQSLISAFVLSASIFMTPASASPITVQSVLFDHDQNVLTVGPPAIDPSGNNVTNGDFLIIRADPTSYDVPVGNGTDEWTKGLFDLRTDSNYGDFVALLGMETARITGATLRLVLTKDETAWFNDQFNLENGPFTGNPAIVDQFSNNLPLDNGISQLITLNLLDYFTSEQLVNYLSGGIGDFLNDGRIVFTYADDATVSGAALTLTAAIPEPGTLALVGVAFLGVAGARRRRLTAA